MLRTIKLKTMSILAMGALAAIMATNPAQAQFNTGFNPFFPLAPRMLTPLGGGVVFGGFGNGFGNGFSNGISFGNPIPIGLNNGFVTGQNGVVNIRASKGFQQPVTSVDPLSGAIRTIDTGLFFQANPNVSPFLVNGQVSGSNLLASQAQARSSFNSRPQRIFRAAPLFNPTVPNPPASAYAAVQATSPNVTTSTPNWWTIFPYNQRVIGRTPIMSSPPMNARSTSIRPVQATNITTSTPNWWTVYPYNQRVIGRTPNLSSQTMNMRSTMTIPPVQATNITTSTPNWWTIYPYNVRMIGQASGSLIQPIGARMGIGRAGAVNTGGTVVMGGRAR